MTHSQMLLSAGVVLSALSNPVYSQTSTIEGLWRAQSETVYRFVQRERYVVGTYEVPNAAQIAAGIKRGDLALKGDYISNVLVGTYYQRAPLAIQNICSEFEIIDSPIHWELNNNSLTGTLLLIGSTDNSCNVNKRILEHMQIERVPGDDVKKPTTSSDGLPGPWPFPW